MVLHYIAEILNARVRHIGRSEYAVLQAAVRPPRVHIGKWRLRFIMSFLLSSLSYSHLLEAYRSCEMARFNWRYCLFAISGIVGQGAGQSSTSQPADGLTTAAGPATATVATATINGSPTTYSVAFTVPAAADVGPNILPNVNDPSAKQAQQLCPGYTASNVQRTKYGFSASLSLAGEAVRNPYATLSGLY